MKKFKPRKKMGWFGRFVKWFTRTFKGKPSITNLNDEERGPAKCIIIGNHSGASGPVSYYSYLDKFFPHFNTWGAHQMTENYRSRWKYLYHIFYQQKLAYGKIRSWILACGFGVLSKWVYGAAGIIPVYYDARLRNTFNYSIECLESNVPVLIFPEDSREGYKKEVEKFWGGFLQLTRLYFAKHAVDLPIYTVYYNKDDPKIIVVGKPMFYQELIKTHKKEDVVQFFLDYLNSLKNSSGNVLEKQTLN